MQRRYAMTAHKIRPPILFSVLTAEAFLVLLLQKQFLFLPIALLALCVLLFVRYLPQELGYSVPWLTDLFLSFLVFGALVLGECFYYYTHIPFWDDLLHAMSGILLALLGFLLFTQRQVLGGVSFAVFGSSLWEMVEYAVDRIFGMNMQKDSQIQPPLFNFLRIAPIDGTDIGLYDTMADLFYGFLGGIILAILHMKFPLFVSRYLLPKKAKERTKHEA